MNIYRVVGGLVAAGIAICVGLSSYVVANEVKAPLVARAVGFPPRGSASANAVLASYATRIAREQGATVTAREAAIAREAFVTEPLSPTAISLIVAATPSGPQRHKLLALAGEITRRNGYLNEEQIKLAASRGDDAAFFRWISRSVLTNGALRAGYVGAMAEATARPGAVASLASVIGPGPSWEDSYWRQILKRPGSLANAAKLRIRVAGAPWRRTEIKSTDLALVSALVRSSQIETAHQLYEGLSEPLSSRGSNLLVNGDFARQPRLPPFDWELAVSGSLGSTIDEGQESLVVSAIGGARGYAARQLVHLVPGGYRLSWSLTAGTPISPSSLSARLYCAERGVKSVAPTPIKLSAGENYGTFSVSEGACRWHWLSIDVSLPDADAGVDLYLRKLSLVPIAATGRASSR